MGRHPYRSKLRPGIQHSLTSSRAPLLVPYSHGYGTDHDQSREQGSWLPVTADLLLWSGTAVASLRQPHLTKPNGHYGADVPYVADYTRHVTRLFGFDPGPDEARQRFMEASHRLSPGFPPAAFAQDDTDVARALRGILRPDLNGLVYGQRLAPTPDAMPALICQEGLVMRRVEG